MFFVCLCFILSPRPGWSHPAHRHRKLFFPALGWGSRQCPGLVPLMAVGVLLFQLSPFKIPIYVSPVGGVQAWHRLIHVYYTWRVSFRSFPSFQTPLLRLGLDSLRGSTAEDPIWAPNGYNTQQRAPPHHYWNIFSCLRRRRSWRRTCHRRVVREI